MSVPRRESHVFQPLFTFVAKGKMDVKKIMSMIAVVLCVLVVINFSQAASTAQESYYNQCISKRIADLERQAKMVDCGSECFKYCGKFKSLQAKFYKKHREELVREMVTQDVGMEQYKVDYYLIKAFFKVHPKLACPNCPSHLYLCEYLKRTLMRR